VRPDLAIEVGYNRLKIPEVWFWEDGVLEVYHLWGEGKELHYEKVSSSEEVSCASFNLYPLYSIASILAMIVGFRASTQPTRRVIAHSLPST